MRAISDRLRSGAPFFFADLYGDPGDTGFAAWQASYERAGGGRGDAEERFQHLRQGLSFVSEGTLAHLLSNAGFAGIDRFFQHFLWGA